MLDEVTRHLDIYSTWGERSGMHNTCENKQLWKDTAITTTDATFQVATHLERGGYQVKVGENQQCMV